MSFHDKILKSSKEGEGEVPDQVMKGNVTIEGDLTIIGDIITLNQSIMYKDSEELLDDTRLTNMMFKILDKIDEQDSVIKKITIDKNPRSSYTSLLKDNKELRMELEELRMELRKLSKTDNYYESDDSF
jgi:hypothetical protein